ncbi:MAG: transposase [Planctomycetota bacterium]|nr:transposase [Planctomycetota bacterium]
MADFSGYIAADELYDGPYCVLSIVDNRHFKRLIYEVLDDNPTEEDILRFFRRFQQALTARGLTLQGVTTDGSPLYPEAVVEVFGPAKHQVCQFHILAELTKAILKAVAQVRRQLKGTLPKFGRGRPSQANRKRAARKKRLEKQITDLFEHRHLFVQHLLTAAERKTLRRITRGQPALRSLRQIMDEAYRLFDRRCRTDTALAKLARLRRRVARFKGLRQTLKKLFSPHLEKALTFLDDSLLPATSNAVDRGNRRHRKMQKTVYRIRTRQTISRRIALDMQRDLQAPARHQTTAFLRQQRRETGQNDSVTLLQSRFFGHLRRSLAGAGYRLIQPLRPLFARVHCARFSPTIQGFLGVLADFRRRHIPMILSTGVCRSLTWPARKRQVKRQVKRQTRIARFGRPVLPHGHGQGLAWRGGQVRQGGHGIALLLNQDVTVPAHGQVDV